MGGMARRTHEPPAPHLTAGETPNADRELGSTGESELVARADQAYRDARREVFDLLGVHLADLTPRQQQLVHELQVAEDGLRRCRESRRQSRLLRETTR